MADLLETYIALTGKVIKKFSSREAGIRQVNMAILSAQNAHGQLGVPKGTKVVEAKTVEELTAQGVENQSAITATTSKEKDEMATAKKKTRGAPASAKTKKGAKPVKKVKAAAGTRTRIGNATIEYQAVEGHRPQPNSKRTSVLEMLKKRKRITMDKLSEAMGFDVRPYVTKLAIVGVAVITPAE